MFEFKSGFPEKENKGRAVQAKGAESLRVTEKQLGTDGWDALDSESCRGKRDVDGL